MNFLNILQGGLYSVLFMQWLNHQGCPPDFLLMHCVSCALLDHGNHDVLLDIPKQFLLPAIDTFQYQVQLLVPVGVIHLCDYLFATHILFLACLCLSVALGVLGYLGEFLLNLASSTLWIFSRVHLAEVACLSAWSIISCDWSWEYSCCTLLLETDLFSSNTWQ